MKRILLFLVALFTISTMVAEITIPTEFDGIVLGKSSRNEVREMLTSKGLVYSQEQSESDDYGCSDVYEGEYLHNGMNFDCVFTRFVGDTIVSVCFKGFCNSACVEYGKPFIENIHSTYNHLDSADSSLLVLSATSDAEGYTTWSRKDGESVILTMQNDSSCFCAYFAESKIFGV